jgi:hypothetical protein
MPQVPYVDYPTQSPSGGGLTPQTINPPAGAFGAGLGDATAGLGREVSSIGSTLEKHALAMQSDINEADVNTASTKWIIDSANLTEQFKSLQGKDAAAAMPKYQQDLEALRQQSRSSLTNPMAQKLFDQQTMRQFGYRVEGAAGHAANQVRSYQNNAALARKDVAVQQAAAANSDAEFNLHLEEVRNAVMSRADVKGAAPETQQAEIMKAEGDAWATRITAMAQQDANAARKYFDQNRDKLGAHIVGVQNAIDNNQIQQNSRRDAHDIMNANTIEGKLIGRESTGRPGIKNEFGYAGLYQFGAPRLETLGVYTPGENEDLKNWSKTGKDAPGKWSGTFNIPGMPDIKTVDQFLASPDAQRKVFQIHKQKMDQEIEANGFDKYIGKEVGGVQITRDGLRAMLHLGGVGGAEAALKGSGDRADANGTRVLEYAKLGSDTNPINPQSTESDMQAWVNEARRRAATAPIPDYLRERYEDTLVQRVKGEYGTVKAVTRQAQSDNLSLVAEAAYGSDADPMKAPKTIDDLPPDVKQRFNLLPADQQTRIQRILSNNAKADYPMTPEKEAIYQQIKGRMATGTPEQRQQEAQRDLTSLELPRAQFRELMNKQRQMQAQAESQTHLKAVLSYPNVQSILHDNSIRPGNKKYDQFAGYVEDALEQWKRDNLGKTRPNEADAAKIVGQLTRKVSTPSFFGLSTSQVPAFQESPPAKLPTTLRRSTRRLTEAPRREQRTSSGSG